MLGLQQSAWLYPLHTVTSGVDECQFPDFLLRSAIISVVLLILQFRKLSTVSSQLLVIVCHQKCWEKWKNAQSYSEYSRGFSTWPFWGTRAEFDGWAVQGQARLSLAVCEESKDKGLPDGRSPSLNSLLFNMWGMINWKLSRYSGCQKRDNVWLYCALGRLFCPPVALQGVLPQIWSSGDEMLLWELLVVLPL